MDFQTLNLLMSFHKKFSHKRIRGKDLSETECMICSYIYSHAGCSQDETANALKTDKTTIAKALAVLEEKDCVCRTQALSDRRRKQLTLTRKGEEKISGLIGIHNEWLSEIMTCLSPEEQKQFENYCGRLLSAAEELADK